MPRAFPVEAKEHVDAVVIGEAENVWGGLIEDFEKGCLKPFYQAESFCSMEKLPLPRLELLHKEAYMTINCVQTTRGCPHQCDFCHVTHFFGKTYRCRPVDEVIEEVKRLEGDFLVFIDDNITGNRRYAKELFTRLKPLKKKWASQASMTLTRDPELLKLAAESGCVSLFIGVESLSSENLKDVNKSFNQAYQFEEAMKAVHDHDILIVAGFIFGLDHDDEGVFERTLRFCERNRIELPSFFILTPLPGTALFQRMESEGRLLHKDWGQYNGATVVFKPSLMTEETLQRGFNWACKEGYSWGSIFKRVCPSPTAILHSGPFEYRLPKHCSEDTGGLSSKPFGNFAEDERYYPSPEYSGFDSAGGGENRREETSDWSKSNRYAQTLFYL